MNVEKIVESSKDSSFRLQELDAKDRKAGVSSGLSCSLRVQVSAEKQRFLGFGGALTEASAYVLSFLSEEQRTNILRSYFSPEAREGNCYTFARTHLNSCDFSLENWACVEKKDETLSSFSMDRPEKYLVPLMLDAQKTKSSPLSLVVSPWSPPAWMKDNNDMNHGGHLLPEYRSLWAKYIVRYLEELRKRGLKADFVTIQNEPAATQTWDSCIWSAREEGDFAVNELFPEMKKHGMEKTGILAWDHNRDLLAERFLETMRVEGASDAISGAAYHWYSGDQYKNVSEISNLFPDKELFFTEGCVEGGPRDGAWFTGERYAHNIINDLNSGCTAWVDWNIALDMSGGPNHVGNVCDSPVLVDTEKKEVHLQSSFYAIGHFSRYIKPGAKRLALSMKGYMTPATVDGCMGNTMEATSFKNPDGSIAVVVTNRTEADMVYELSLEESQSLKFRNPPRSIQTLVIRP